MSKESVQRRADQIAAFRVEVEQFQGEGVLPLACEMD